MFNLNEIDDNDANLDATEAEETQDNFEEEDATGEPAGNPALTELYEVLPKSLHGLVEPVINKWQSGIDQQFQTIAPYRKYADAGVDPDVIEASLELAQQISANPRGVYDELAERYGWKQAEQMMQQAVAVAKNETDDSFYSDPDVEEDPAAAELAALRAEMEALKQERNSEREEATEKTYEYEINSSLDILRKEYGDFDEEAIMRRAMILSDDYPTAELPQLIGAAFEQYQEEVERIRASVKRAPRVAGGAGNSIPAPAPVKLNTREDRVAAIEDIVKRTLGQ